MRPRLVDWSLLALVLFEAGSGLYSFLQGRPENSWLFVLHGVTGLALVLLLVWKLRRVRKRVADRRRWDRATSAAVAALVFVLLAIGTGVVWTTAQWPLGYPNGMNWHVIFVLATHVGGVPLDHGHGAPLWLVAPGRRGFQWVKWVNEVRVLDAPDLAQWGVIFSSGL